MTLWILGVLGLWVVQTFLPTAFRTVLASDPQAATVDHLKAKDHAPDPGILGGRLERARLNMLEALPVFLSLALLLEIQGQPGTLAQAGAATFLIARVIYIPTYAVAVLGLRTLVWAAGAVGLVMMAAALFV